MRLNACQPSLSRQGIDRRIHSTLASLSSAFLQLAYRGRDPFLAEPRNFRVSFHPISFSLLSGSGILLRPL